MLCCPTWPSKSVSLGIKRPAPASSLGTPTATAPPTRNKGSSNPSPALDSIALLHLVSVIDVLPHHSLRVKKRCVHRNRRTHYFEVLPGRAIVQGNHRAF